ncbi:response regulator transcription factor [Brachybacterium sp. JHP9]|uniref:Response regulator transcription factor n=1 Tax=Brachybacterium equifaecis TaxID=2910770 RepID=A0ABT0QX28_9MICO|nr:response regulator transcription factor [Brachybacterium equifaecis]MCL6422150.1 response regulator transcription factor [Brachybacterium equifaecis]
MSARPIRVLVVDDHRIFAAGVSGEITAHDPGLAVVGQADDVESAIAAAQRLRPDVVLLDVHLPGGLGGGGAEVADALHELTTAAGEPVRALALSVSDAEDDVLAVIRAGARGYVTKSILPADLVAAIRRVAEGDAVFSPRLAGFVLDAFRGTAPPVPTELDLLSPREQEVMKLIARGYTYREAGSALFISDRTVESHVSSVLRKLQLTNRRELARWARDRRVI